MNNEIKDTHIIERMIGGEVGQRIATEIVKEDHDKRLTMLNEITPLREARKAQQGIYIKEVAKTEARRLRRCMEVRHLNSYRLK